MGQRGHIEEEERKLPWLNENGIHHSEEGGAVKDECVADPSSFCFFQLSDCPTQRGNKKGLMVDCGATTDMINDATKFKSDLSEALNSVYSRFDIHNFTDEIHKLGEGPELSEPIPLLFNQDDVRNLFKKNKTN